MIRMRATALLLSLAAITLAATPATADNHLNYGFGRVTNACQNPEVLGFITSGFGYRATHYLKMDIAIAEIRDMRQSRLVLRDETRPVQREYCRAVAVTTDGEKHGLWYLIERGFGFAGIGSNIEFCLSGLDPWYVYGAQCASLR